MRDAIKLLYLLLIHGTIHGRTRFQKLVFLLQKKYNINFSYTFVPYFYGPYSKKLQIDVNWLSAHGFIDIHPKYHHQITPEGVSLLAEKPIDEEITHYQNGIRTLHERTTSSLIEEAKSLI
jgi:uncharacterized protein YwgA